MFKPIALVFGLALSLGMVGGCSTNPVTGRQELTLVSTDQEIAIGRNDYGPARQAQGGDYVLEPDLTRYVNEVGQKLAAVSDRKLPYEFKVVNDSTPNAWALPGGKIAVNRGLLVELDNEAELAAVLGHEIVHAAAGHSAQGIQRGWLLQGTLMAADLAVGDSAYGDLARMGGQLGAGLIDKKYGRDDEREADLYGMRYMARAGYDPAAAVRLQETFVRLFKDQRQDWLTGLFASHPPSQERVENNRRMARKLGGSQGILGREHYQRMIARLKRNKPAYEAYDKALDALAKDRRDEAMQLVDKAIAIEPKESLFQGLRGDLLAGRKRPQEALQAYNRAIEFNPNYFKHYLTRGLVKRQLGDVVGATSDLRHSQQLLPTAEAKYGLGQLAMEAGDRRAAVTLLRDAATTESGVSEAAARDLARLDLRDNPARYVIASVGRDRSGYLSVAIINKTAIKVAQVRVVVGLRSDTGFHPIADLHLRGPLGPNERRILRTNLGPMSKRQARDYGAIVSAARVAN